MVRKYLTRVPPPQASAPTIVRSSNDVASVFLTFLLAHAFTHSIIDSTLADAAQFQSGSRSHNPQVMTTMHT